MTAAIYKFFNNRINLLLLGFSLFPLFFTKYVESLCDQYLKPIYLNLSSNWIVDVVSLCLCVLIVLYYLERYKKEHLLSAFRVRLLFIGTGWYIYFRFQTGWNYGHFSFWDSLYYLDSIIFLCGVNLLYCLFPTKWIKDTLPLSSNENKKRFLTDQSLEFDTSDYLGRKEYANSITTTILNTLEKDHHTFAIGIVGEWGAGKTSFFTMMKASEDIKNGKAIYIDFNPWLNHQNKDIVGNFFAKLKEILGDRDSKLAFQLDQYVKQLTTLDDNIYFKTIDFLTKLIFGTKSIKTIFLDINDSIARLGKPIIIFIDDLDRLDSSELVEVIKLIRISANFENTAFVAAYDKEYVNKAIEAITKHNQNLFLEKIFQAEFHLPTFEAKRLKNYCVEELKKVVDRNFHNEINSYFKKEQLIFDRSILTLRDVKRFVNQFQIDFNQVEDEVLFSDFMNLALIKYKHFDLYEFIRKDKHTFLTETIITTEANGENSLMEWLDFSQIGNSEELSEKDRSGLLSVLFKRPNIDKEGTFVSNNDKEKVNESNGNSIRRPSKFDTYFALRLLDGKLSSKDFNNAMNELDENRLFSKIKDWFGKGYKDEIHDKLDSYAFDNGSNYIRLFKAALTYCSESTKSDANEEINSDDIKLLKNILERGKKYKNQEDISSSIKSILKSKEDRNIKIELLSLKNKRLRTGKAGIIERDSLISEEELLYEMLKESIDSTPHNPDEIWEIYGNCIQSNRVPSGQVNNLILDYGKTKNTKDFFERVIDREGDKYFIRNTTMACVFSPDAETRFKDFLEELEDTKLKQLVITFKDKLDRENSDDGVTFDFEGELDI